MSSLIRKAVVSSGLPSSPSLSSSASKESWTITCYSCGMPSSSVWAKLIRCHRDPSSDSTPYYPQLLELPCPSGAVLADDGTTHLCAFCFASLESQWSNYEKETDLATRVHPKDRKYNLQKFVCAVCGVQTYRKRIRALPFQEFPFLTKDRQPGSLTLGQNPLAIVCLDCSETLWAQSAEYERWGLPIQKRHFNWMARPPPPENSMEATVARLPSGETQLPRCPPIEPSVSKGRPHLYSDLIGSNVQAIQVEAKSNGNKVDLGRRNYKILPANVPTSRKASAPCLSSAEHAQFPPVVTVAPMSSYKDSMSVRKGSASVPPLAAELFKADSNSSSNSLLSDSLPPTLGLQYPATRPIPSFLDSPAYKVLQWHPRDFNYPYNSLETSQTTPTPWPWIPTAPHSHGTDFMNYQSYLASLASRSFGAAESYIPPSSIYTGSLPVSHNVNTLGVGVPTSPYTASTSFLSPALVGIGNENGHGCHSPRSTSSGGIFISPSATNKNTSPSAHALKRKGSLSGNCDISPKSRPTEFKDETRPKPPQCSVTDMKTKGPSTRISDAHAHMKETSSSYPHFKKRWNEAQSAGGDVAVDLSKKTEFVSPASTSSASSNASSNTIARSRANSFSIAFLCNETLSLPSTSPTRESVIVPAPESERESSADKELTVEKDTVKVQTTTEEEPENITNYKAPARASGKDTSPRQRSPSPTSIALKMSDEEVKEFVEKAKQAYKMEERKRLHEQRRSHEEKADFLKPLNLITTKQASELELKKTISRAEKRTLAPIEFRPTSPKDDDMNGLLRKEVRRALSENKYSNHMLKLEGKCENPHQQDFLEKLGLQATSQNEKLKIEQQWCLTLLEKLLRVTRNGTHKESKWNTGELSKLVGELANACRVDSANGMQHNEPFTNLSLILSPEAEDLLTKQGLFNVFNSSDLLSIVNSHPIPSAKVLAQSDIDNGIDSKLAIIQPVISYPRYIPSYATSIECEPGTVDEEDKPEQRERANGSILNIPSVSVARQSFLESQSQHGPSNDQDPVSVVGQEHDRDPNPAPATSVSSICIPKVPMRRSSSESSTHCENQNPEQQNPKPARVQRKDTAEGKLVQVNTNTGLVSKTSKNHMRQTNDADDITGRYTELMKGLRNEIDNLLSSAVSVKEDRNGESQAIDQIRKLRSALVTYQLDLKLIERKLRKGEKEIMRFRRLSSGGSHNHNLAEKKAAATSNGLEIELEAKRFA